MAIAGSGAISLSDFRTEFIGGSSAVSLSDFYRGGSNVRSKAANNNATNLAADLPTSGAIAFDDFYGTAKGFRKTYSSGATNQDASSVFGDDYGVDYPKEIVIDSGVELGATSASQEALQIDSGLSGTMKITNNGTLSGAGGAIGSSGGDAFQADVACTLINNGTIRGGGGGGGGGGTGGQGRVTSTGPGAWSSYQSSVNYPQYGRQNFIYPNGTRYWYWGSNISFYYSNTYTSHLLTHGGYDYESQLSGAVDYPGGYAREQMAVRRRQSSVTTYTYHNGGSGGSGGVGQGYNQSAGSGSGGSSGGTNAGNGGSGGSGGSFGSSGSAGNNGANGNYTNGTSGSNGGAAGKYIIGQSNVTFTNNGTVQGGIS